MAVHGVEAGTPVPKSQYTTTTPTEPNQNLTFQCYRPQSDIKPKFSQIETFGNNNNLAEYSTSLIYSHN
jgi:hypothetical protein